MVIGKIFSKFAVTTIGIHQSELSMIQISKLPRLPNILVPRIVGKLQNGILGTVKQIVTGQADHLYLHGVMLALNKCKINLLSTNPTGHFEDISNICRC